jgi:hypothetical protein
MSSFWGPLHSALKAVSQNLMHSNLSVTDGVYGILSESDVRGQIEKLGEKLVTEKINDTNDIISLLDELISRLKSTSNRIDI